MKNRQGTGAFFGLAFALTWCLQIPGVLARRGWLPGEPESYLPVAMLGIFGPLVAATYLTFKEEGRRGVKALFSGPLAWRVSPKWYVLGLLVPGALLSAVLWSMQAAAGREHAWYFLPAAPQLVIAFVIAIAEETGWRGYALPRLAAKYGWFVGSCLLGALWAIWHVPMFLAVGIPMSVGPVMLLFFVGGSLFFAWLYRGTSGSLLIAVLAHVGAHLNNSHAALPESALPLVVHTVVYAALGFATMRSAAFERVEAITTLPRLATHHSKPEPYLWN